MIVIITSWVAVIELVDNNNDNEWPLGKILKLIMTTSNVGRDSIPAVDNVQTSSNIYDHDDDVHSW